MQTSKIPVNLGNYKTAREKKMMSKERERRPGVMKNWLRRESWAMLFLGFSAGLPLLLIFSTLSVWLREAGVEKSSVTFFSWAALGYSFKFLWAPLVDLLPLPVLTARFGRRRAWMLVAQLAVALSIVGMSFIDPQDGGQLSLVMMAFAAVALGFSSATQDIVIDAYRIESADASLQAFLSSMYIAGYRIGMIAAGAGSLFLADNLGTSAVHYDYRSWQVTYLAMAVLMGVGVCTTLCIPEPVVERPVEDKFGAGEYRQIIIFFLLCISVFAVSFFYGGALLEEAVSFEHGFAKFLFEALRFSFSLLLASGAAMMLIRLGVVKKEMVRHSYVDPVLDFFARYGTKVALLLLLLIGFYRLSDIVLGVISNVFYLDMGYSKTQIATAAKTFGLLMTLLGGFLGGLLTLRYGVYAILMLGAVLSSLTNLLFMLLASVDAQVAFLTSFSGADFAAAFQSLELYAVIGADNLAAGIATTAFIAFLSSLTGVSFTAVQYAIFSSLMTLIPKVVGGYSGTIVEGIGYSGFFFSTAVMGVPVILLVWLVKKMMEKGTAWKIED